jgi:hypothetical protein
MAQLLTIFLLTFAQNASFTLVSRARNSKSILYHSMAAMVSNGLFLLVFMRLSTNLNDAPVMIAYLMGSVSGSVWMHWLAMKFWERD